MYKCTMKTNDVLLSPKSAATYYKKLIENHISNGTCEQRIMILRLRFDNVLSEIIPEIEKDEQSFYQKKLELIFDNEWISFPEYIQSDTKALTQLLNKIQHSELVAEEELYLNCLIKLVNFISFCSNTDIPNELKNLNLSTSKANNGILPLSICVDTKDIVINKEFRETLFGFLKKATTDYPVEIELIPIGNLLFTGNTIQSLAATNLMTEAFKNVSSFVSESMTKMASNKSIVLNPPSLTIVLLTSEMLNKIKKIPDEFLVLNQKGSISTIVIGLNREITEEKVKNIFPTLMAFENLQNGKIKEMFAWICDLLDTICRNK